MTDPKSWPRGVKVTVNDQPWHPLKSVLFVVGFVGLCAGIVVWRQTLGRL